MLSYKDFCTAWRGIRATGHPGKAYVEIIHRYCQRHRHYHDLSHIDFCMNEVAVLELELDPARAFKQSGRRPEITSKDIPKLSMALIGHDVVYDPLAKDNEEQSAALMSELLHAGGTPDDIILDIDQTIISTKRHDPITPLARTACDIDVAIFGAAEDVFDRYESSIELEYPLWVVAKLLNLPLQTAEDTRAVLEKFIAGRTQIISQFYERPEIFLTEYFRFHHGTLAKKNLERSLAKLKARMDELVK